MLVGKIIAGDNTGFTITLTGNSLKAAARGLTFKTAKLEGLISSVEIVTPANKETFLGTTGWLTQPPGSNDFKSLAAILAGSDTTNICFACRLSNGQKFIAIAPRPIYDQFYAESLHSQLYDSSVASQSDPLETLLTPNSQKKRSITPGQKGCLGCLGVYFAIGIIISAIDNISSDDADDQNSTVKVKPSPTESPTQKKQRLAEAQERRLKAQAERVLEAKKQADSERLAKVQREKRRKAVRAFANLMNASSDGQIFSEYSTSGEELTLRVDDAWYLLPKQVKLDRLKTFHFFWAKTCGHADDVSKVGIKLESATGSRIGGWDALNGSWVED